MPTLSVDHLLKDHREGERILDELEALLNQRRTEGCWTPPLAENFARFTRFFDEVVLGHIRKEEEVLFPVLEAYLPRDIGPLAVLRGEHGDLYGQFQTLLEAGRKLSAGGNDGALCAEFDRVGRTVIQGFRDHVYKEDRILFPMVSRFLSAERDAALLDEMEKVGALKSIAK